MRLRHLVAGERLARGRVDAQDRLAVVRSKLEPVLARHITLSPTGALHVRTLPTLLQPALCSRGALSMHPKTQSVFTHDRSRTCKSTSLCKVCKSTSHDRDLSLAHRAARARRGCSHRPLVVTAAEALACTQPACQRVVAPQQTWAVGPLLVIPVRAVLQHSPGLTESAQSCVSHP